MRANGERLARLPCPVRIRPGQPIAIWDSERKKGKRETRPRPLPKIMSTWQVRSHLPKRDHAPNGNRWSGPTEIHQTVQPGCRERKKHKRGRPENARRGPERQASHQLSIFPFTPTCQVQLAEQALSRPRRVLPLCGKEKEQKKKKSGSGTAF